MRGFLLVGLLAGCVAGPSPGEGGPPGDRNGGGLLVLGVAQDGGRPQLDCRKDCCSEVETAEPVASLAVFGEQDWILVDATPDLPKQVAQVGTMPTAILLTHAHIGHYLGLAHLGREVMGADRVPVWCSARMAGFLRSQGPWSQLVELGNIELRVFEGAKAFDPIPGVSVLPIAVPHRDEFSDTHGFSITTGGLRTLYLPDIDSWEAWGRLEEVAAAHDVALLDATFFDDHELPGRDMSRIPHPRVPETMRLLAPLVDRGELEVWFTHLNHTNPMWDRDSEALRSVQAAGFGVAERGMWLSGRD